VANDEDTRAKTILDDATFTDHFEACLVEADGPDGPPPTVMMMFGGRRRRSADRAVSAVIMRVSDVPNLITSLIMTLAEHADQGKPADADASLTALVRYARALRDYSKTLGVDSRSLPIPEPEEWGGEPGGEPGDGESDGGEPGEPDAAETGSASLTIELGMWRDPAWPGGESRPATMTVQELDATAPVMMLQRDTSETDICIHGKAQCVGGCNRWVWLGHVTEPRVANREAQPWCVECVADAYALGRLSQIPVLGHVEDGRPGDGHAGHAGKASR
jgi:hypothetical protein